MVSQTTVSLVELLGFHLCKNKNICRNSHLWTAVDCAAAHGWTKTVTTLLDYGAPIDPVDKTKVLLSFIYFCEGHLTMFFFLLTGVTKRSRKKIKVDRL